MPDYFTHETILYSADARCEIFSEWRDVVKGEA